jgi:hypothetical protein
VFCVVPFMVSALMAYPFLAIMGGGTDPFLWERSDRVFYFICVVCFGFALLHRLHFAQGRNHE